MNELDNSAKNIGIYDQPKEGERRLLSSNAADVRSPSLGFISSNSDLVSDEILVDYLAELVVEVFLEQRRHAKQQNHKSSSILPNSIL